MRGANDEASWRSHWFLGQLKNLQNALSQKLLRFLVWKLLWGKANAFTPSGNDRNHIYPEQSNAQWTPIRMQDNR